jgi:hypothetical protein
MLAARCLGGALLAAPRDPGRALLVLARELGGAVACNARELGAASNSPPEEVADIIRAQLPQNAAPNAVFCRFGREKERFRRENP